MGILLNFCKLVSFKYKFSQLFHFGKGRFPSLYSILSPSLSLTFRLRVGVYPFGISILPTGISEKQKKNLIDSILFFPRLFMEMYTYGIKVNGLCYIIYDYLRGYLVLTNISEYHHV